MLNALAMLLWSAVEVVLVLTAQWLVPFLSGGRWHGESQASSQGRMHGPAGALSFQRDGQRVLTSSGLLWAGLALYALVGMAACAVASLI